MSDAIAMALALSLAQTPGEVPVLVLSQQRVPVYAQVLKGFALAYRGVSDEIDVDDQPALSAAFGRSPELVVALGSKAFDVAKSHWADTAVLAAAVPVANASARSQVVAVPTETRASDALAVLSALVPGAKRVAAFYPATNASLLADAQQAASVAGLDVSFKPVNDPESFRSQFKGALAGHDAAWVLPDNRLATIEMFSFMAQTCQDARIPLIGFNDGMTAAGALASVSVDYREVGRESAKLAVELVAMPKAQRGGVPSRFASGKVTVNEKTMAALAVKGKPPARAQLVH